ncbi:MAG: ribosomal protein S18-alanine N-acetyltransferase [Anaerolineae bacterium]
MGDSETTAGVFRIREMRLEDVDQVAEIEKLSFPLPWPPDTYRRDLRGNNVAHYLVCEDVTGEPRLAGYTGYWHIQDEIHISTLAVVPGYRGRGLGEYLLASALAEGIEQGAHSAILEVRASNLVAQGLYLKYGFRVSGRRRRYYRDNNEDALVMEVTSLSQHDYRATFHRHWEALRQRLRTESGDSREGEC